jgi:hypothetical protein
MKIITPLTAAVLFAITGVFELAHEQVSPFASTADYLIEAAFTAALAAGWAAVALLEQRRRGEERLHAPAAARA